MVPIPPIKGNQETPLMLMGMLGVVEGEECIPITLLNNSLTHDGVVGLALPTFCHRLFPYTIPMDPEMGYTLKVINIYNIEPKN